MKYIFLVLLIAQSYSLDIQNSRFTSTEKNQLKQAYQSHWGSFIMNYAELHLKSKGYLSELLKNIEELIVELNEELQELMKQFNKRTNQHNRDVTAYEQEIGDANREIFNSEDMIQNVLLPNKNRLNKVINQLHDNIESNRKALDEETEIRKKEKESFELRIAEHNQAVEALDECLNLISTIANPSFTQIQRIQSRMKLIQEKLMKKSSFAPLVRALIQMADKSNLQNQDVIRQNKIINSLNELRVKIVDSINQETADEKEKEEEFEDRVRQLNAENAQFQRDLLMKNEELTATNVKIEETYNFISARKADLKTLQGQLEAENNNYAQESEIFESLKVEYLKEIDSAKKALQLLSTPSFMDQMQGLLGL